MHGQRGQAEVLLQLRQHAHGRAFAAAQPADVRLFVNQRLAILERKLDELQLIALLGHTEIEAVQADFGGGLHLHIGQNAVIALAGFG